MVSKDALRKLEITTHLQGGWHLCPRQQEDAGLAQGEPYEGVGGGGLSS